MKRKSKTFGKVRNKLLYTGSDSDIETEEMSQSEMVAAAFLCFAEWVLTRAMKDLIDIRTGFYDRGGQALSYCSSQPPPPVESETRDFIRQAWIWDLALQKATRSLPHPYYRDIPVSKSIIDSLTFELQMEKDLAAGATLANYDPQVQDLEYDYIRLNVKNSRRTIDELTQGITLAPQIEAELQRSIPKTHPDVIAEIRRLKAVINADSTPQDYDSTAPNRPEPDSEEE